MKFFAQHQPQPTNPLSIARGSVSFHFLTWPNIKSKLLAC
jgi:hypothetical protein